MKQQTKGGALHRLWQALPWLWMAAAYLFDLWYQLVPGKWIVDSDLASEMILSDLLNKEGSIISHNWFYSTELKVVNLQWFYRLGLLLFPDDWHLARAFGMAVTLALYAACMLFFVKCARLGRPGLWMVGTLLWPFGQHYLVYAIYGGYYLVYTFFYMLVLALVLRSLDTDKKHCALQSLAGVDEDVLIHQGLYLFPIALAPLYVCVHHLILPHLHFLAQVLQVLCVQLVAQPPARNPRIVQQEGSVLVCLAALLWCCEHDDCCHGCCLALYGAGNLLSALSQSVVDCPAFNHRAAIAEDAHIDCIIVFRYACCKSIYILKTYAVASPPLIPELVVLAVDVVVYSEFCH